MGVTGRGLTLKALLPLLSMSSERLHFLQVARSAIFQGKRALKVKPCPNRKYLLGRCYEAGSNAIVLRINRRSCLSNQNFESWG